MKLPTNITWHPWRRWFESSSTPVMIIPTPTIQRNVTPREIQEARAAQWRRVP